MSILIQKKNTKPIMNTFIIKSDKTSRMYWIRYWFYKNKKKNPVDDKKQDLRTIEIYNTCDYKMKYERFIPTKRY